MGRRLTGSSVKMLIAVRSDVGSRFDTSRFQSSPWRPCRRGPPGSCWTCAIRGSTTQTRRIVMEQAMGNPLALLELPAYVNGGHHGRTAEEPLGFGDVPLSRRLQHVYGIRIERLPAPVRDELLRGGPRRRRGGTGRQPRSRRPLPHA
ncbi:hypothetical protein [Nonomuraea dietziae]|uniref:hypothetical protein n=1 Tax=Nonomuraea dietziae TaxID=65515 RepID=UPI0031DB71E0